MLSDLIDDIHDDSFMGRGETSDLSSVKTTLIFPCMPKMGKMIDQHGYALHAYQLLNAYHGPFLARWQEGKLRRSVFCQQIDQEHG